MYISTSVGGVFIIVVFITCTILYLNSRPLHGAIFYYIRRRRYRCNFNADENNGQKKYIIPS